MPSFLFEILAWVIAFNEQAQSRVICLFIIVIVIIIIIIIIIITTTTTIITITIIIATLMRHIDNIMFPLRMRF
jgi:hypothetical protein